MKAKARVRYFELCVSAYFHFIVTIDTFINRLTAVASIMGSDVTPNGLRFQFHDRLKPIARRQLDMKAAGQDPKDVDLDSVKGGKNSRG